ncbi:MAG TPA: hypothetical protein VK612_09875, partial [Pyrinomonadaceae bacterium]|nr:hypothetical protein [Pyrinomonadaceae bacterium]
MSNRIEEMQSPFLRWRRKIWGAIKGPLGKVSSTQRFWIGFALFSLVTTLLIQNPIWQSAGENFYKEGDIARESIISPADIYFVDEAATERDRETARAAILPIFSYEPKRADEAVQNFRSAWENMQRKAESSASNKGNANSKADASWTGAGGPELGKIFSSRKFSPNELDAVTRLLRENASGDIYSDQDEPFLQGEVEIVDRQKPTDSRQARNPASSMTSLSAAREKFRTGLGQIRSFSEKESEAFFAAAAPLLQPSVIYDASATDNARRLISEGVPPVAVSLKRSQKIADEGDIMTPEILSKISAISNYSSSTRKYNRFLALLALITALYWAAWKFVQNRGIVPRLTLSHQRSFALLGFIVVAQTVIMAMFFRLADFTSSQNVKAPLSDPSIWSFAVPFAFGSLLMTLLA